jgi:signal transduction histidine kinase
MTLPAIDALLGRRNRARGACRAAAAAVALALAALLLGAAARAAEIKTVLVIYGSSRLLPATVEAERAIRENVASTAERPVELYTEYLDAPRFGSPAAVRSFERYLHEKYAEHPPDVILAAGSDALELVIHSRAELFPEAPVVHVGSSKARIARLYPLPSDVIGVPVVYDSAGTVEQALRWHPNARRLVVVTGASDDDRELTRRLRDELAPFAERVPIEYLSELGMPELEKRLAELEPGTVVFTPGFFQDGESRIFTPRETAEKIAAAAPAPVYAPYDTFLGTGVVGGRVPSFAEMGKQGAELINQILAGAAPQSLQLPERPPIHLELDWRQARRWGIRESDVPAGAVIRFKDRTFWEAHRAVAIGGLVVMLLQTALIGALLVERRRRRRTAAVLDAIERRMSLAVCAAGLSTWTWDVGRTEPIGLGALHPADRSLVEQAARAALAGNSDLSIEYRVLRSDGEVRWHTAYGRADQSGGAPRLLGVSRDITERKLAERDAERDRAALRHMMRASILGQLSASIAHQLNQPLAAILSNAEAASQLLAREPLDVAELCGICADIVRSDQRAVEVVRRLGALFRRGEVMFEPFDLNGLLRETLELTRSELVMRHVALVTDLAGNLPPVEGERIQLQQVFLNLVMNAADAMDDTTEGERELSVRTAAVGHAVSVWIRDSGSGIGAREIERVFDPFWTTKPGGMGMGLAICRSIVDLHHGTLLAANNPDRGATFCVTLPGCAA